MATDAKTKAEPGMMDENIVEFDIQPYLTPASILLSALMISISIFVSFGNGNFSLGSSNNKGRGGNSNVATDDVDPIEQIVLDIDVNLDQFKECQANSDFADEIQNDTNAGQAGGITGTPGFIIGTFDQDGNVTGEVVSGAQPFSEFSKVIDSYLDGSGNGDIDTTIDDDPILGDLNSAKVAIVEFSDFECPFCQRHHQTAYKDIVSNYVDTGDAVIVYRDFPLSFHEPKASEAAEAANCVFEVAGDEAFFEFSELYYERTQTNGQGII